MAAVGNAAPRRDGGDVDLRAPSLPALPAGATGGDEEDSRRAIPGALVRPGAYTVTVQTGGAVVGRANFTVRADPRQDASPAVLERWHVTLDSITTLYRATVALEQKSRAGTGTTGRERADTIAELQMRVGALFQALETQVGPPTADMRAQLMRFSALHARLARGVTTP